MKLKCIQHERRVHVFDGKMVHRDGRPCDGFMAMIGDKSITIDDSRLGLPLRKVAP